MEQRTGVVPAARAASRICWLTAPRRAWSAIFTIPASKTLEASSDRPNRSSKTESSSLVPLVMVVMNLVYASTAFPFGKLSDKMSHRSLLMIGLFVLFAADLVLANSTHWSGVMIGVALWGVHMGMTQGLLATMVASAAPEDLRGTAFGFFNLVSGLAMLTASITAGFLWDRMGAASTFYAGAIYCVIALVMLVTRPRHQPN